MIGTMALIEGEACHSAPIVAETSHWSVVNSADGNTADWATWAAAFAAGFTADPADAGWGITSAYRVMAGWADVVVIQRCGLCDNIRGDGRWKFVACREPGWCDSLTDGRRRRCVCAFWNIVVVVPTIIVIVPTSGTKGPVVVIVLWRWGDWVSVEYDTESGGRVGED